MRSNTYSMAVPSFEKIFMCLRTTALGQSSFRVSWESFKESRADNRIELKYFVKVDISIQPTLTKLPRNTHGKNDVKKAS
jgi:hypothetical protein